MAHLEPTAFLDACRRKIRGSVGAAALQKFLRAFRNSDVAEGLLPFESEAYEGVRLFLQRHGVLESGTSSRKNLAALESFVRRVSRESGTAPVEVSALLHLFADGDTALGFAGVCRPVPACQECGLAESCRFQIARRPAPLPEQDRPAVRLEQEGESVLTTAELLSLLLTGARAGRGRSRDDAERLELARKLLEEAGGLAEIASLSVQEIRERTGMRLEGAAAVKAALVLGRRSIGQRRGVGTQFRCGEDFYARYAPILAGKRREVFITALLDTKNRLIRDEVVSEGTLNESIVHPREVFSAAIRESANAVAFIHNHPSGDPSPSRQDKDITARLVKVAQLLGIKVLDHIIVGTDRFFSFVDEGLI